MFILSCILLFIVFISYILIVFGGIALLIGIPAGICYGIYELYRYCANRYCANRSNNSSTDSIDSSDDVNIVLPHVAQSMHIETSLQQSVNMIQSKNYEQV